MSIINQKIPEFKAEAYHNGEFKTVSSEAIKGQWSIFLFYPADFTFVCSTELEDMAKHYSKIKELGTEVYSISTDTHFCHQAWHDSNEAISKINYPMIGDHTGVISRGFDVMIEENGLALRGTFIIDPDGVVKTSEVSDIFIGRSAADTIRKLQAAQYVRENDGEFCPASWQPAAAA
ncbi:MAG: alkyl hydroperoxide reductase subunit C [Ostreibacterium sp.]